MANKRDLKKYMKMMAADVAGETAFILDYYDNIDENKAYKVIDDVLVLLTEKIANVSVAFDKTCKLSFDGDRKAYRKAHTAYFKNCYKELLKEFDDGIQAIVKEMNSLLSKEQLAENKKIANEA
ncbi:MAG: hypothetical protein IAB88_08850 [Bacteroidetes bacterium]|uniref:Uncharacterized protein n=1 Tax=Candidatus Limisoma faecipullorum TaxID=2840854 RepID=A0A9D9IS54_9BACT|nr:hypothetical protein [Candidatus Limisoma faecipullorum]